MNSTTKPIRGEQLGGDLGAGIHDDGIDQEAVLHAVEQRVAVGGLAVLAAEGAVGVQQQPALGLARVAGGGHGLVEPLQVVAGRGGEAELVADEVVEDGAGVAADGAMRFVGDHQVEVGGREELLIFVVEEQRLDGGDDNLGAAPVVAVLFVNDDLVVVREHLGEGFLGLILEFQAIHQEEDPPGVAGAQEELDDRRRDEGLPCARGHLEQKPVLALLDRALEGGNGFHLIGPQEAQAVGLNEAGALGLILPCGLGGIAGALREDDVVGLNRFLDEAFGIGNGLLIAGDGRGRRKSRDQVGIAAFKVPEVMQVAVGEDDEAAVLGSGIFAGLLLADERVLVLRFGLQDDEREAPRVEQQEVDETLARLLEVLAERVEVRGLERHAGFKLDVGG